MNMHVVLLGAGGGMGRMAARHLARTPGIDRLVLSDARHEAAQAVRAGLDTRSTGVTVDVAGVDILDGAALRARFHDADVVLNCAGPFFRLGVPVLEAAIETGTAYIDICDDPAPTRAMLALDARAREAGVSAVIGMGASPGLSNLLARRAARHLDVVESCFTAWPLDLPAPGSTDVATDDVVAPDGRPTAAAIHLMEQISGVVDVVDAGQLVERAPLRPVMLDYPGRGSGTGYVVGHPEPITLHTSLALTGDGACLMLVRPASLAYLREIQRDLDRGRLDHHAAALALVRPTAGRSVRAAFGARGVAGAGALPSFFVHLTGTKDGARVEVGCHLTSAPTGMDGITAIPAVLALRQMLDQPLAPGVHAPEQVIDPDRLLLDLLPHCTPSVETVDDLAPVAVRAVRSNARRHRHAAEH
jgi:saccharopine dehydrogenase-like NADP-dependent oxidoreductase